MAPKPLKWGPKPYFDPQNPVLAPLRALFGPKSPVLAPAL